MGAEGPALGGAADPRRPGGHSFDDAQDWLLGRKRRPRVEAVPTRPGDRR